uniref:Uncharacterized protein n=1 Tax=Cacopsylla melanoneura TaxID=428564 RepID=A0A8D8TUR1_9HEMI
MIYFNVVSLCTNSHFPSSRCYCFVFPTVYITLNFPCARRGSYLYVSSLSSGFLPLCLFPVLVGSYPLCLFPVLGFYLFVTLLFQSLLFCLISHTFIIFTFTASIS